MYLKNRQNRWAIELVNRQFYFACFCTAGVFKIKKAEKQKRAITLKAKLSQTACNRTVWFCWTFTKSFQKLYI